MMKCYMLNSAKHDAIPFMMSAYDEICADVRLAPHNWHNKHDATYQCMMK